MHAGRCTRRPGSCRTLLLPLLLPVLLLLAQQAALLHELGHWRGLAHRQADAAAAGRQQGPGDSLCLLCLGFAQVAGATTGTVPSLPTLPPPPWAPSARREIAAAALALAAARSRGPPLRA